MYRRNNDIRVPSFILSGAPEEIRTPDPQIRSVGRFRSLVPFYPSLLQSPMTSIDASGSHAERGHLVVSGGLLRAAYRALTMRWLRAHVSRHGPEGPLLGN